MILALDFETGGTNDDLHGPVTLGVAVMEGETVVDSKEWLFQPARNREYTAEATAIHGYSLAHMREHGQPIADVLGELHRFAFRNKAFAMKVVAYNAPFDFKFYSSCLFLAGERVAGKFRRHHPPLVGPWQCAMMIASNLLTLDNYKLDTAANHFGLSRTTDKHGAMEDAILAGRVFARLAEHHAAARKNGNVATDAEGPVAEAQRHLATCERGTAEYAEALAALNDAMRLQRQVAA